MITNRNGHLIYGKRAVLIRDVTESVCDRKKMDWLTQRFPLAELEVLECIDCIADIENLGPGEHLKLNNAGDAQDVQLETISISDTIFLKLIQFGRIYNPECTDIDFLFDQGFKVASIEVFEDLVAGHSNFENSELHSQVYNAYKRCLGNTIEDHIMLNLLKETNDT